MMQRTQILLDLETKNYATAFARENGLSFSELVRQTLKKEMTKKKGQKKKISAWKMLMRLAERAGRGPGDSEYDKYAYNL